MYMYMFPETLIINICIGMNRRMCTNHRPLTWWGHSTKAPNYHHETPMLNQSVCPPPIVDQFFRLDVALTIERNLFLFPLRLLKL